MTDHHEDTLKDNDIDIAYEIVKYACSHRMYKDAISVCNIYNKKWKYRTDIFDDLKRQVRELRNAEQTNGYLFGVHKEKNRHIIFITKKSIWIMEKCCDDYISKKTYNLITKNDIYRITDGEYGFDKKIKTKDLIEFMEDLGFQYDKEFEEFMLDSYD